MQNDDVDYVHNIHYNICFSRLNARSLQMFTYEAQSSMLKETHTTLHHGQAADPVTVFNTAQQSSDVLVLVHEKGLKYMSDLQLFSYFVFLLFTPRFKVLLCECGVKRRPNWKGIFVQNELHIGKHMSPDGQRTRLQIPSHQRQVRHLACYFSQSNPDE